MKEHAVVIAGGGPTGVMLAAKLTLAGIDVVIIERHASWTGGREHESIGWSSGHERPQQ